MGNWKHPWLTSDVAAAAARNKNPLKCMAACLFGLRYTFAQAPPKISEQALLGLCWKSVLALCFKCLPKKQTWHVLILSPFDVWLHLALSQYHTWWRAERFLPFLFQINWHFVKIVFPTLDHFKPHFKDRFFLFSVHAYCISLVNPLFPSFFFTKVIVFWCFSA